MFIYESRHHEIHKAWLEAIHLRKWRKGTHKKEGDTYVINGREQ
jgi:hypothetical protein